MKRFILSIVMTMAFGGSAHAEQRHALHGLFCNTEGQIEQALTYMRNGLPPQIAAEVANQHEVTCVYADRIQYVIIGPANIGQAQLRSFVLYKYKATLVGVIVGGNLRPVEPPVEMFLLTGDRLPGAIVETGI